MRRKPRIFWATRDLSELPIGNHHFLYVENVPQDIAARWQVQLADMGDGRGGFTMGANVFGGRDQLEAYLNDRYDLRALHEKRKGVPWYKPDYDLQSREVPVPDVMTPESMVDALLRAWDAYRHHSSRYPVRYHPLGAHPTWPLCSGNCASWVNSILAFIGIDRQTRQQLGDFRGVDCGQNLLLDLRYFDPETTWDRPPEPPRQEYERTPAATTTSAHPADVFEVA